MVNFCLKSLKAFFSSSSNFFTEEKKKVKAIDLENKISIHLLRLVYNVLICCYFSASKQNKFMYLRLKGMEKEQGEEREYEIKSK